MKAPQITVETEPSSDSVVTDSKQILQPSLRIALVCDHFLPRIGGIELQVFELAKALQRHGHKVRVLTGTPGEKCVEGVQVERLPTRLMPGFKIPISLNSFRALESNLKKDPVDLVHCHSSVISPLAYGTLSLCHRRKIPAVLTCHSLLLLSATSFRWLHRITGWQDWSCVLSAVSNKAAKLLGSAASGKHVRVLPNGVDPAAWRVEPQAKQGIHVVSVMRMNRKKRPDFLVEAIPEILKRIAPDISLHFHLVGKGPFAENIRRRVAKRGLMHHVTLHGALQRSEIRKLFSRCDLFVLPTRKESFGIAALEARCAGLPVVGMKDSGVEDLIESGKNGLLAANREEFIAAITRLVNDETLRIQLGRCTLEGVEAFSWETTVAKHLSLYHEAMLLVPQEKLERKF